MTRSMTSVEGQHSWQAATEFIDRYDTFLVASHIHPDGDAIGSTLATAHILRQRGKSFVLTNDSPVPDKYHFLEMANHILPWETAKRRGGFQAVVCVDAADRSRLGAIESTLDEHYPVLNIDHHPTNAYFADVNIVMGNKAATTEMLYDLAEHLHLQWTQPFAEAIYTGIMTDTGGFRYANTTPNLMKRASHLLQYGVVPNVIAEHVFENMTKPQMLLLRTALNSLSFSGDGKVAWMTLTSHDIKEADAKDEDVDGLVNYARNVKGVEVGILFREADEDGVKVSMRSRAIANVGAVAKQLGGGGHERAAGCYVKGQVQDVRKTVLFHIRSALVADPS